MNVNVTISSHSKSSIICVGSNFETLAMVSLARSVGRLGGSFASEPLSPLRELVLRFYSSSNSFVLVKA